MSGFPLPCPCRSHRNPVSNSRRTHDPIVRHGVPQPRGGGVPFRTGPALAGAVVETHLGDLDDLRILHGGRERRAGRPGHAALAHLEHVTDARRRTRRAHPERSGREGATGRRGTGRRRAGVIGDALSGLTIPH